MIAYRRHACNGRISAPEEETIRS